MPASPARDSPGWWNRGRVAPHPDALIIWGQDCGGCQFQHLDQATQLSAKRSIVQDALTRIGGLDFPVADVIAEGEPWAYRTRITLALGPGRRFAGFHPLDEAGRVFDLEFCEVAAPPLMRLWKALRRALHQLPPDVQQLVLRLDRAGNLHLLVKAVGNQVWGKAKRLAEILASQEVSATIWWQPERGAPRVVAGTADAFPATVFEQVHPVLGDRIRTWALSHMSELAGLHVWDLYAGIGGDHRGIGTARRLGGERRGGFPERWIRHRVVWAPRSGRWSATLDGWRTS